MAHGPSLERDIGALRRLLDDAFKGMRAAEAALLCHSKPDARLTVINFPLEESLLRDTVDLLTGGKRQATALLRRLDTMTASVNLQFERLFDENAGRQSESFLRRRAHLGPAAPEVLAAELVDLLAGSAALDRMLREAKPVLVEHHRNCEACLLRLVVRRRQVDVDLEEASNRVAFLKTRAKERRRTSGHGRNPASDASDEEERRTLALERQAAQDRDEALRAERETLQRMTADDEDFVEALNAGLAAANIMAAKLAVDIEQRVALLKAITVHLSKPATDIAKPVQALITAFDANILAGHDLLARKQRTDDVFLRRMVASIASPEDREDTVDEPETSGLSTPPPI
jgi:predicted  nucleic acid-binding Zn-ribbon protein